jgi:hypothetical protein
MLSCVANGLNVEAYVIIQYEILSGSANVIMWIKCYSCGLYFSCVEKYVIMWDRVYHM